MIEFAPLSHAVTPMAQEPNAGQAADVRSAAVVVIEVSPGDAGVMYALGLCQGVGHPPVLLVRRAEDLPTGLRGLRYIIHFDDSDAGLDRLRVDVGRRVADILAARRVSG